MRTATHNLLRSIAIMLAVVLLLMGIGCRLHHDNDKCLNDGKIRHYKKYHK